MGYNVTFCLVSFISFFLDLLSLNLFSLGLVSLYLVLGRLSRLLSRNALHPIPLMIHRIWFTELIFNKKIIFVEIVLFKHHDMNVSSNKICWKRFCCSFYALLYHLYCYIVLWRFILFYNFAWLFKPTQLYFIFNFKTHSRMWKYFIFHFHLTQECGSTLTLILIIFRDVKALLYFQSAISKVKQFFILL